MQIWSKIDDNGMNNCVVGQDKERFKETDYRKEIRKREERRTVGDDSHSSSPECHYIPFF